MDFDGSPLCRRYCVVDSVPDDLRVVAGVRALSQASNGQIRDIIDIRIFPGYRDGFFGNDVALLLLDRRLELSAEVAPIDLITDVEAQALTQPGTLAHVSGWGLMSNGTLPDILQAVSIPIVETSVAEKAYGVSIGNDQIAVGGNSKNNHNSCSGDSGGPLVVQRNNGDGFVLAGIVSWGLATCDSPDHPGLYSRVSWFEGWIRDQITKPSVSIITPTPNEYVSGSVLISVTSKSSLGPIAKVILRFPDGQVTELVEHPYTYLWDSTSIEDGYISVSAQAIDVTGATSDAVMLDFWVENNNVCESQSVDSVPHHWSIRLGGHFDNGEIKVATDNDGNTIVAGEFRGTMTLCSNVYISAGKRDIVIAKLSGSDGACLWSLHAGSAHDNTIASLSINAYGNPVIVGMIDAFVSEMEFGGHQLRGQIFVAKLRGKDGSVDWARGFAAGPPTSNPRPQGLDIDPSGDILVAGNFDNSIDLGGGPFNGNRDDIFVAKLAGGNGGLLWLKGFGDDGSQYAPTVSSTNDGNVIVAGHFSGTLAFGKTVLNAESRQDVYIANLNGLDGSALWAQHGVSDGIAANYINAVDVNSQGQVIACGHFRSELSLGSITLNTNERDLLLAKFDANGTPLWMASDREFTPSDFGDRCRDVKFDADSNVLVTGAHHDLFVAKYATIHGRRMWAHEYSAPAFAVGHGRSMDVSGDGTFVVAGWYSNPVDSCFSLGGPVLPVSNEIDLFVTKLGPSKTEQNISLRAGWNFVSFYVAPTSRAIEWVFGSLGDNLVEVLHVDGDAIYRFLPTSSQNTLTGVEDGKAYWVYVEEQARLNVKGMPLDADEVEFPLQVGWNDIGNVLSKPTDVNVAFRQILGVLELVVDGNGHSTQPGLPSSITLRQLIPGAGYKVKVSAPTTLILRK